MYIRPKDEVALNVIAEEHQLPLVDVVSILVKVGKAHPELFTKEVRS